jgi:PAS domain S-box-containing protein
MAAVRDHFAGRSAVFCEEYRVRCKDGAWKWVLDRGIAQRSADGQVVRMAGSESDITERQEAQQQLRLSEQRFRLALRNAPVSVAIQDRDLRYIWAYNQRTARPDEIIGHTDADLFPTHAPHLNAVKRRVLDEGVELNEQMWIERPGGRIYLDVYWEPIHDAAGQVIGVGSATVNLTAIKLAEEALRESEERLRLLGDNLPDSAVYQYAHEVDGSVRFHYVSSGMARLNGVSIADVLRDASILHRQIPEAWRERLVAAEAQSASEMSDFDMVVPMRRSDGQVRWMHLHSRPRRLADGRVMWDGVQADVTARRQVEEALRESEAKFRTAIANAAIGFSMSTPDGHFIDANPAYCRITGYSVEELRGRTSPNMIYGDDRAENLRLIAAMLAGEIPDFVIENRYLRNDGRFIWVRKSVSLVRDDAGAPRWIITLVEDIDERKRAEAEIQHLNTDLERRVTERTAELTAANRELDSFAYAVSHDLRSPLRAMCGFSQVLLEDYHDLFNPQARSYLEHIDHASRRMSDLVDGILTLSRSTRGEMRRDKVDLGEMARRILDDLARIEPGRQVMVEVEAGLWAWGDARMLDAVLANLLGNAWKYTAHVAQARIRVYSEQRDGAPWFCIADNGAGFDMAYGKRLFQPFQRLHRQDEFPGLGIGLATVQRIVHRHGGQIEAHGETGKGAVFSFTLPQVVATGEPG